jgi:protein required for attachment to host cells
MTGKVQSVSNMKIETGDWVVVCDGRKALILQNAGDAKFPNLRTKETHEHANPPTHEQGVERPGRTHQSMGAHSSAMEQTDWHDASEREFLKELANRLDRAIRDGETKSLTMIAAPRALGMIRQAYSPAVEQAVARELSKDLVAKPIHEIEKSLTSQ